MRGWVTCKPHYAITNKDWHRRGTYVTFDLAIEFTKTKRPDFQVVFELLEELKKQMDKPEPSVPQEPEMQIPSISQ